MISYLKGKVLHIEQESLILEVSGVGYELFCSQRSLANLQIAQEREFFVYTYVREDHLQLFGFLKRTEKQIFLEFIKISGVGAKMAIGFMSGASVEQIRKWVHEGDVRSLSTLPKVGKKKAEQIVIGLRGKLDFLEKPKAKNIEEIHSALVNLGFKPADVQKVVSELDSNTEVEEGVRKSLQVLGQL